MNPDKYPHTYLWPRLTELLLFCVALFFLAFAILTGVFSSEPKQGTVASLGILASLICIFLEYRQRTIYEHNHIEASLLSGSLYVRGLNTVARWRHRSASANVVLVVLGVVVSGYGSAWGAS